MGNRGYYNFIFLKGEIMGLDGVKFNTDYAAKFNATANELNEETKKKMQENGTTVPIVAQQPKDLDMGLKVQANPENKEENDKATAVINATEDGQGAVEKTTVEQDDADPNVKVQKDEAQADKKVADETPKTAVEETAANRAQAKAEEAKKAEDKPETKQAETKPAEKDPIDEKLQKAIRYNDKDAIKACQEELSGRFKYKYNEYGDRLIATDDKSAEKMAKAYVENAKKRDKFERTIIVNSGAECTAMKKQLSQQRKDLAAKYQAEGLSKKDAKKRAEAEVPNRVVDLSDHATFFGVGRKGYRKAYNFVNAPENREKFFKDGKLDSDAVKKFFLDEVANADTDFENGEVTNYRGTLHEQGKAAAKYDIKRSAMGQGLRAAGGYADKDRTPLYIAGATAAGTAIGAGVGAVLSGSAASLSISGATAEAATTCAEASAAAGAAAGAEVTWNLVGAGAATGAGVGFGLGSLLRDKGRTEDRVYGFNRKPEPVQQGQVSNLNLHLDVPQPDLTPTVTLPEVKPCPEDEWIEDDCKPKVIPGSSWAYFAEKTVKVNNKKIAGTKYYEPYLYAQQLMYKIPDPKGLKENRFLPIGSEYQQYSDFGRLFADEEIMKKYPQLNVLKDVEIEIDCGALKDTKVRGKKPRGFRYGGHIINAPYAPTRYTQSCNDNVPVPHYD